MSSNNVLIIVFLVFVVMSLTSVVNDSFGEIAPEIMVKAERSVIILEMLKNIDRELTDALLIGANTTENLQTLEDEGIKDIQKIKHLTKEFEIIRSTLNKLGIATANQFAAEPDYWRGVNASPFPDDDEYSSTLYPHMMSIESDFAFPIESDLLIMSHGGCGCGPQKGYFRAGFDWWVIPQIWITAEQSNWVTVTVSEYEDLATVITDQSFEEIRPWGHFSIKNPGSSDWLIRHAVVDPYYGVQQSSVFASYTFTSVKPSYGTVSYAWLDNIKKSTAVTVASKVVTFS